MAKFLVTNTAFMIFDSFMNIFDMSLEINQKAEPLLTNMTFVFFATFVILTQNHFEMRIIVVQIHFRIFLGVAFIR